jgi:hypothetical protein
MARVRSVTLTRALVALLCASGVHARRFRRQDSGSSPELLGPDDVADEYDYIVVGGGTAGLTVADRLTESGECKLANPGPPERWL